MNDRKALLVVSFGTSYPETRQKTIDELKQSQSKMAESLAKAEAERTITQEALAKAEAECAKLRKELEETRCGKRNS